MNNFFCEQSIFCDFEPDNLSSLFSFERQESEPAPYHMSDEAQLLAYEGCDFLDLPIEDINPGTTKSVSEEPQPSSTIKP